MNIITNKLNVISLVLVLQLYKMIEQPPNPHKVRNKSIIVKTSQHRDTHVHLNKFVNENTDILMISSLDMKKKMNDIILVWYVFKKKQQLIMISKGFNRWKYLKSNYEVNTIIVDDGSNNIYKTNEHKNNYLLLFAENEKLRSQLTELRNLSVKHETKLKQKSFISIIRMFVRSFLMSRKRYYYDIWMNNTNTMKFNLQTSRKALELESGLQYIDSERNYIKSMEVLNSKLKLSLSIAIYFFKWKSTMANLTLTEERKLYDQQRKLIFNELIRMR